MLEQLIAGLKLNAYKELKGDSDGAAYMPTDLEELKDLEGFMLELGEMFSEQVEGIDEAKKETAVEDYLVEGY